MRELETTLALIDQYQFVKTSGVSAFVSDVDANPSSDSSNCTFGLYSGASSNSHSMSQPSANPSSSKSTSNGSESLTITLQSAEQHAACQAFISTYSGFIANGLPRPNLTELDLEEVDPKELEAMDLQWMMAMVTFRTKKFWRKYGNLNFKEDKTNVGFDISKVRCYNCNLYGHFSRKCKAERSKDSSQQQQQLQQQKQHQHTSNPNSPSGKGPSSALVFHSSNQNSSVLDWSQHALEYSPPSPTALIAFEESLSNSDVYWPSLDELPDAEEQPQMALMADLPEEVRPRRTDNIWHVDSGCSRHMTGNLSLLYDFQDINGPNVAFWRKSGWRQNLGRRNS